MKSASLSQIKDAADAQEKARMAAAVAQPVSAMRDEHVMDTRTPSPVQRSNSDDAQSNGVEEVYRPDLANEVAMLSTKLVNAINYQTNLDDTLQHTRHDLEQAQQELRKVRSEKQSLNDAITQGVLVKKSEVDKTIAQLRQEMAQEKLSRENAEKAKRQTEGELEDLTARLFEEANSMVAEARKDTQAVERRNSQLKSQLGDSEVLLTSQQEQLQDLKLTMENLERTSTNVRDSMPSTPVNASNAMFDAMQLSPNAVPTLDIPPDHPLHFSHLLFPVLRTDISAYTDFSELLGWARRATPHSRSPSGNVSSASQTNLSTMSTAAAANSSSPNLPGAFSFGSSSASNSPSSSTFSVTPPLKESKFYKRVLVEDLEPTLRLDLAPGLSFLSRRTVNSSLLNGSLVVEPFTQTTSMKFYSPVFACALCGESRKTEPYIRKYRFRTSESEDAQRYPLCDYCLGRIRAAGDFVGFLRMVRDGHWRCGNEEEDKAAWEEAVRLRERMFWARLGGGVVPAVMHRSQNGGTVMDTPTSVRGVKSEGRPSLDSIPERRQSAAAAEDEKQTPEVMFKGEDREGSRSDGIGRAIVNMSSRAASTAVPELQPQPTTPETADPEPEVTEQQTAKALKRRTMLRADDSTTLIEPVTPPETAMTGSQQDQAEADAQLQEKAEAGEFRTPPLEPEPQFENPVPAPAPSEEKDIPGEDATATKTRTDSQASITSPTQRRLSPQKRPENERRPSSASSVLARVRAMEAKK